MKFLIIAVIVIAVVSFFISLGNSSNKDTAKTTNASEQEATLSADEYKALCKSIAYKDIARKPDDYKGEYVTYRGKVEQIEEHKYTSSILRISVTEDEYGFWDDTVYVTYDLPENSERILEDDIVTFYGICQGTTSYTSIFGQTITIPAVDAEIIEIES